jgi:hypothetical protein
MVESLKKNSPPLTWTETPFALAEDPALVPDPALVAPAVCVFAPPAGAFSE